MLTSKRLLVLFAVTVVAVVAAVIVRDQDRPAELESPQPYFPQLLEQINDVAKALVKSNDSVATIAKDGETWRISEKNGYPADTAKVRELLLGLARLQRIEGKTSNPDQYNKLDINDITEAGSKSNLVQLLDGSGNSLAVLVVGKNKRSQGDASHGQFYVRSPGDPRVWLVEGLLPRLDGPAGWTEKELIGAELGDIRSVTVMSGEETLTVARDSVETTDFELQGLRPGEEVESQYAINQIARSFEGLSLEDVKPQSEISLSPTTRAVLESFDGIIISLALSQEAEQTVAQLNAEYKSEGEQDATIQARVQEWNDLWGQWAYVLPDYQADSITVEKQDLLKVQEPEQSGDLSETNE